MARRGIDLAVMAMLASSFKSFPTGHHRTQIGTQPVEKKPLTGADLAAMQRAEDKRYRKAMNRLALRNNRGG